LADDFWFDLQSPDGDVIDCVPTQLQPAFEHPKLRGHRPEVRYLMSGDTMNSSALLSVSEIVK
jgi:hypothetical protein